MSSDRSGNGAFQTTGSAGNTSSFMGATSAGTGLMKIMNGTGKPLVLIACNEETGALQIMNTQGKEIAGVTQAKSGEGFIHISGPSGEELVSITAEDSGNGHVRVNDSKGVKLSEVRGDGIWVAKDPGSAVGTLVPAHAAR